MFAWGLGETLNNQVESLAVCRGLQLSKIKQIIHLIIVGYLVIIIHYLALKLTMKEVPLFRTMWSVHRLVSKFEEIKTFHAL